MDKKIQDLKKNFDSIEVPSEIDMVIETAIKRGKKTRKINFIRPLVASVAFLLILITVLGINKYPVKEQVVTRQNVLATTLPKVGSYENLQVLLKNTNKSYGSDMYVTGTPKAAQETINSADAKATKEEVTDHSNTNQQVKGVDEGDNVKNDGEYIYKITGNKLIIVKAIPAEKMRISSEIDFEDTFHPSEILIKGESLIVIGGQGGVNINNGGLADDKIFMGSLKTQIRIFDIKDKKNPKKIRSLEVDGTYSQSRLINSSVYIVSNKYINFVDNKVANDVPTYKDSLIGDKVNSIGYDNIGYCKEALEPNYIMITSLNLDNIKEKVNITTVLGSGSNVYASENNIYVAGVNGVNNKIATGKTAIYKNNMAAENTTIYKFKLGKAKTEFVTSGVVKGSLLNQFSMDENKGYFRITTTENSYDANKLKNNLFVMSSDMKVIGKLEGIAPTEKIYSTRFIGDRAYMVTFKQTDPLFVIDLKIPEVPKVLGELKIPGYSNYLEPYDENHLIGFGQDTIDINVKGRGNVLVRPIGMKIAMFDVTDVTKPIEQFQTKVQGENSYSEVLNDHKALLFSKEKNLLSFPVQYNRGVNDYYQGASVYKVDLKTGFTLRGNITHGDIKAVKNDSNLKWQSQIDRELYIGDNLYTISNLAIKANNLQTLNEVSQLTIR